MGAGARRVRVAVQRAAGRPPRAVPRHGGPHHRGRSFHQPRRLRAAGDGHPAHGMTSGRWRAAAAAVLAAACSSSWPIKNDPPRGTNVIAFGDSLTQGYRMKPGDSWPDQLSVILGLPILNMGVSGNTTADGLARLEA